MHIYEHRKITGLHTCRSARVILFDVYFEMLRQRRKNDSCTSCEQYNGNLSICDMKLSSFSQSQSMTAWSERSGFALSSGTCASGRKKLNVATGNSCLATSFEGSTFNKPMMGHFSHLKENIYSGEPWEDTQITFSWFPWRIQGPAS